MGLVGQPDSLPPVTATIGHVHIPADTRGLSTLLSKNPNLDPPSTDKEQGSPLRERSINASGKSPHTTPGRASGAPLTPSKRRPAEDAAIDSSPKPSPSKVARASTKTTDVRSTTQSALPVHSPVGKRLFGSGAPTDGAAAGVDSHMLPVASPRQLSSTIRVSPAEQQVDLTEPTPQKGAEKESDTVHMLDEAVKHPTPRPSVINMELPRESVSPLRSAGDEGPSAAPAASEGIEVDQEGAHFVDEATPRQMDIADTNGRHLSEAEVLAIFDGDLSEDEEMHRQVALRSYQGNQPLMEQLYEREMEAVQRHPLLLGQGGQIAGLLEGVDTSESRVVVLPDDHEISTPGGAAVISTSSGAAVQTPQGVTLAPDRGTPVSSGGEQVYNALDALDSPEFDEVAEAVRRRAEEANRFAQQIKIQNDAALLDGDLDPEETARIEAVANRAAEEAKFAEQVNQQKVADLLDGELDVDEARKIDAVANRAAEIQQFEQQRSQPKSGLRGLWSKLFGTK